MWDVEQVARRARQPVEAGHEERVARVEGHERLRQFAPVGLRAAGRFPKYLDGSGGA